MSADDRREVIRLINEWNSSRYELFALSQPNERLEFHGVMRFYFQDAGEKVSTKCIRVDSTASTEDVIKVLIEKFRPDMKSLSSPKDYAIYEVHADSQERKLGPTERPLWIQLDWGKDGREGRFLLKNENAKTVQFDTTGDGLGLLRDKKRLSKREKKKLQKLQNKEASKENKANVAENLYKEVPDSNFTRSISNPEIVMARRRQQKLENKLKQIKNRDGGGTLKVYGETLKPDIPYKTLLMSNQDTAAFAVKETLEKYGLPNEEPENYCLVQVVTPSREEREKGAQIKEYILEDNACPLAILMKHPSTGGSIIFQIRRCTPDILAVRKQKKKTELEKQQQQLKLQSIQSQPNLQPAQQSAQPPLLNKAYTLQPRGINPLKANTQTNPIDTLDSNNSANSANEMTNTSKLPFLVELNHDGFELQSPRVIQIKSDFYEIGNDKYLASTHPTNYIRLDPNIPGIEKKHCALKKSNDNLQLLLVPYHETYVNDRLIKDPTQLFNNFTIRLGKFSLFRLENPNELNGFVVANNTNSKQQPAKPLNGNIPPNYGTLYDNGQVIDHPNATNNTQSPQPMPRQTVQTPVPPALNGPTKPSEGLPGLLEFPDDGEDALLANICQTNQANWQFKLAPVYTMYMMLRYRLSQKYKSELSFNEKLHSSALLIHKMVNYIREAVDQNHSDKYILPYWLANSSELLYFLKQDTHLNQISYDAQELLADCVQITFKYLVNIMQQQLDHVLGSFFDPSDHIEDVNLNMQGNENNNEEVLSPDGISRPTLKQVIQVLNETMNLLRGSRVNAALTIQLFSQLFHYVSMWLFNRLINDQRSGLCSRYWGDKLTRRLNKIQIWAEKQGLELAADCHLSRIIQAAFFLQTPKHDVQDLSTISSNCFALNSLQIRCLLKNYLQAPNEPPLSVPLCNNLISIAQNTADEVLKQEGRNLQLEEEVDLQLPFLLPEDGHSCEFIKGLPAGLLDFLENLQNSGHCWLWQNTQGPGSWKKFMSKELALQNSLTSSQQNINMNPNPAPQPAMIQPAAQNVIAQTPTVNQVAKPMPMVNNEQPKLVAQVSKQMSQPGPTVIKMRLSKKNNSLGLSIVAARGTNQINTGIYIKSVVPSGAADEDGRLSAGDQLLAVDDVSLINVTQERAAELMTKSGASVCLTIAKEAATYHDLDALLNKSPLPQTQNSITASMPALNNNNMIGQPQIVQSHPQHFTASTLPRNHQHQNGYFNGNQPMNGNHLQQQMSQDLLCHDTNGDGGYRARSMSQEVLKANNTNNGLANAQFNNQTSPVKTALRTQNSNGQVTSPTHQYYQRGLPNEQQIRYGSERPSSAMHHSSVDSASRLNYNPAQRNLPNDPVPRFGSERPASSMGMNGPPRFTPSFTNGGDSSPIKQAQVVQQHQQQQNLRTRQASLSELDEINYHNKQTLMEQQQQQQQQQVNSNKFDDLYGKVNRNQMYDGQQMNGYNAMSQPSMSNMNQQYKTLPSRANGHSMANTQHVNGNHVNGQNGVAGLDEQQRTKSFGQLYEQMNEFQSMKQSNSAQQPIRQTLAQVQPQNGHFMGASVDDLNLNKLEISNNNQQQQQMSLSSNVLNTNSNQIPRFIEANKTSRSNLQPQMNGSTSTVRVIPITRVSESSESSEMNKPRNYENQIINQNQNRPPVSAKPVLPPGKPFGQNGSSTIHNNLLQNGYVATSQSMTKLLRQSPHNYLAEESNGVKQQNDEASTAKIINRLNGNGVNNWEKEQLNRQREDEEFRTNLLEQRMELLRELESKQFRSSEEENRLNKLKTEIEFDRRVLEMNSANNVNYLDETNEENDMEYSPEVRERIAIQMRDELLERRRKFEELEQQQQQSNQNDAYNQKLERRFAQFEKEREEQKQRQNIQIQKKDSEIEAAVLKQRELNEKARIEMEEYKKRRSDEADRLMEMKREEMRLRRHIDLAGVKPSHTNGGFHGINDELNEMNNSNNNNGSFSNGNHNGEEIDVVHLPSRTSNSNLNMFNGNKQNGYSNGEHIENGYHYQHQQQQQMNTNGKPQKHVQFMNEAEIMSPKSILNMNGNKMNSNSNSSEQSSSLSNSNPSTPPPLPNQQPPQPKRVMFGDAKFLEFERNDFGNDDYNGNMPSTPSVIGANEFYVDPRLKRQQLQQQPIQFVEGEKLSFKDKMKLFAKQSGEMTPEADTKLKVSKKQREIESKFESK